MAVVAFQEDAVVFAGGDILLEGDGGGAVAGEIDLQGVEEEEDVSGEEEHAFTDAGGHG